MATNQFLMLDEITMEYHSFRKDQLLTHKQLNDLIDYFEDQDRLTRTCLIGVGLVCGLHVSYNQQEPSITVGKGCGVTTDGDLLSIDSTTYRHFRVYQNRKKGTNDPIYDPFFPATDSKKQIDLWELILPDAEGLLPAEIKPLNTFNTVIGKILDDLVVLLYLENYLQDPDKCTAIDCDNQGPHQVARIRVLLLSKVDMDKVINKDPLGDEIYDSIYLRYNQALLSYFNLPALKAKRVILNPSNTSSIVLLAKSYTGIVQTEGSSLIAALEKMHEAYQFLVDPAKQTNINEVKQALQQAMATQPKIYHAQYLYDFYKDVLACYNELKDLLFRCISECCPDKHAFPKHIMLGELIVSETLPAPYLHDFYPSPAITKNRDKTARCRSMWLRLQQLIQRFNLPDQPSDIKITPSTDYDRPLEKRAIPFYFKDSKTLVRNWNYKLNRKGAEKSILSYHAEEYAAGIDATINPLNYSIDANNFFRIEGHLGKQLSQAMAAIDRIKNEKSVPFDLLAIRINRAGSLEDINTADFDCQFEDLNAILKAWLIEQNCLYASISKFFSGFSTNKALGYHTRLEDYRAVTPPVFIAADIAPAIDFVNPVAGIRSNLQPFTASQPDYSRFDSIGIFTNTASVTPPICKTIYTVDKTVVGNLETAANSLGLQFAEAFKMPAASADDLIADVKRRTANDPNLATLSADEKEIVYDVPINLISHISAISQLKPFQINEINTDSLQKYMERMVRLCAYVKKLRSRMESIFNKENYSRNGFEPQYLFLIQQLIANCCAAEKLESLQQEIERRKRKILDSLLLANYATQHPGLEHKAGVHRGGTFVLVYSQQIKQTDIFNRFTNLNLKTAVTEIAGKTLNNPTEELNLYEDLTGFAYFLVTQQGKVNFDDEVEKFMKLNGIKEGSLEEQLFNRQLAAKIKAICALLTRGDEAGVAPNVVVADFTLPYLCCSDCPPLVFLMPKQQFNLALPKSAVCNDEDLLEFRKEPADGIVKSPDGFDSAIVDKEGHTFFDPSKVPAASFGKEISFTINDQVTDCKITVFKHPTARFKFEIESEDDTSITVIYNNASDDRTGKAYIYEWDFGDKSQPRRVDNKEPITVTYKKALLERLDLNGKITVKLTATNGSCTDTITQEVPYKTEVPVSLTLPIEVICNDQSPVKFTVEPADGIIASAEESASVVKINNEFFFDPQKVQNFGNTITFTVNGKPTTCKVMVFRHPKSDFDFQVAVFPAAANMVIITFTNKTDPQNNQQLTYNWSFSDGTSKTTTSAQPFQQTFNIAVLRRLGQTALTVILESVNPGCADKIEKIIPFQDNPPQTTCTDTVKGIIDEDVAGLQTPVIVRFLANLRRTSPQFAEIKSQLNDTISILKGASSQSVDFDQPVIQADILNKVQNQLDKLYQNQFDKLVNDTLITPQVRALLKLAVNVVKCSPDVSGNVKEILMGILRRFTQLAGNLADRLSMLNTVNVLIKFLRDYMNTKILTDTQLIDEINGFAEIVKSIFQP